MALKKASRTAQRVLSAEFDFNFNDTMVPAAGGAAVDFGATNIASTVFEVINLPINAVVVGGAITRSTAFDAATYTVSVGDSGSATRYLGATDVKGAGTTALVPTGYVNAGGLNVQITVVAADVCTTGAAKLRVDYVIAGRADEVYPS
jgi:hypothetical protein